MNTHFSTNSPSYVDDLIMTATCRNCGKKTTGQVHKDAMGPHMLCSHCDSSFDVEMPPAPQRSDMANTAEKPETAFDRYSVNDKPQQVIYVKWYSLDSLFTNLLTDLLGRSIKANTAREDYYWWKVTLEEPITPVELERLFELIQASKYERDENAYTDGFPIMELCQGLSNKLMNKLLPFTLVSTRADDDGVWFIGDELKNLDAPMVKELPDGSALVVKTGGDPLFPGVYINLIQADGSDNDDLLCVAEFNSDRAEGKKICICVYAHNLDEPTYYASYHDDGKPCADV